MPYLKTVKMTVDNFSKTLRNPMQRDTEHHAKSASKNHLKEYHESHAKVAIAVCGKLSWILDGHTRLFLWKEGTLQQPEILYVEIWEVRDKAGAVELYQTYDNSFAVETKSDKVSGALRLMGINNANRMFLRNTGLHSAIVTLNMALRRHKPKNTVIENMRPFKKELQALVDLNWLSNPGKTRPGTPSCVIAAFIVTYRLYHDECLGFWDGYYCGKGREMTKSGLDGSLAAVKWIRRARENKELMGMQSPANIIALLTAFEFYWEEKNVTDIRKLYKKSFKNSSNVQLCELLTNWGFE